MEKEPQTTSLKVTKTAARNFAMIKAEFFEPKDNASFALEELMKNYRENNKI